MVMPMVMAVLMLADGYAYGYDYGYGREKIQCPNIPLSRPQSIFDPSLYVKKIILAMGSATTLETILYFSNSFPQRAI